MKKIHEITHWGLVGIISCVILMGVFALLGVDYDNLPSIFVTMWIGQIVLITSDK